MKNKKNIILVIECVIILCLLTAYYFIFLQDKWNPNDSRQAVSAAEFQKNYESDADTGLKDRIQPNIEADIEVINNKVSIKQSIALKEPVDTFYFYIPSKNIAKTTIKNIQSEKGFTNVIVSENNLRVDFEDKQTRIYVEYEMVLNNNQEPLSYTEDSVFLTNFLITPAVYKNGEPVFLYKSSFGDPYIYNVNHYSVRLKTDNHFTAYAPGKVEEDTVGDSKITIFQHENARDFPIAIFKNAKVEVRKYGEKDIYYIGSLDAKDYIEHAMAFAESNIGPYPYKEFYVVKAPLSLQGMEFSNMIFLSESCFHNKEVLKRVAYHEVFHQWFYGIIGTDQLNEPFLDEGLVNYLSLMLSNNELNRYFNEKLFQLHLRDYHSRDQYYHLAYNDSAVYFYKLHKKLGDDFYNLLKKIYAEKKLSILYFDELLKYAEEYLGGN
ncbi:M1 family aminopeptidase [Petroclostridium sp. X23]|uniref:M1 family aminopeptidase n=1 Tax=Petroclostridium sp. X23 TaxID=3045146 RepID=UPI0024ACD1BC|nr:M1 family aminopeptidase [Petroclostridium sp. X23]WHH57076.1 M1 family aminopeptidase [Petroclostridium sp. X23]